MVEKWLHYRKTRKSSNSSWILF